MIEKIIPSLKNAEDYQAAMYVLRDGTPLTKEEADKLAALYQKYGPEDPELARLFVALDMMPGRGREDAGYFAGLELPEGELEALFLIKDIASAQEMPDEEEVNRILGHIGKYNTPVNLLVARTLLNRISGQWNFGGMWRQASELAEVLAGCPDLEKYAVLMMEVQKKCRE